MAPPVQSKHIQELLEKAWNEDPIA
jgi:hypothetical protein